MILTDDPQKRVTDKFASFQFKGHRQKVLCGDVIVKQTGTSSAKRWLNLAFALCVSCAAKHRPMALVPQVPAEPLAAELRVSLVWVEPVDLDVYVTDPSLESIYFGNPRSQSGGVLGNDVACADIGRAAVGAAAVERVEWARPPGGRYRVGVDFPEACGSAAGEVAYRVVVEFAGKRQERSGTVHRAIFEPVAFEFDVPGE